MINFFLKNLALRLVSLGRPVSATDFGECVVNMLWSVRESTALRVRRTTRTAKTVAVRVPPDGGVKSVVVLIVHLRLSHML